MFVQQLLLQFSTDFYEIWFFIMPNIVSDETTKKNPEKSGIRAEIRDFLTSNVYNITLPFLPPDVAGAICWNF